MLNDKLIDQNQHDGEKQSDNLYLALERNELELCYQPRVDSRSKKIVGLEAMIKWNQPSGGVISPEKFISTSENTELISQISEWTLRTACLQNKIWQKKKFIWVPVAVNYLLCQFEDGDIVNNIIAILKETGLSEEYLNIEITVTEPLKDYSFVAETIRKLKQLGIGITIGDSGKACSALGYIKMLPVDAVKVDRCLLDGIGVNKSDEAIATTMIALINQLNMNTVAEGVETKQQIDFLMEKGCYTIQGNYFYKPMPTQEITKLLCSLKNRASESTKNVFNNNYIQNDVYKVLNGIGVKHACKGYRYLIIAIQIGVNNPDMALKNKDIYEIIAAKYNTKASSVERAIRYVIMPFGMTNKEFISKAIDDMNYANNYIIKENHRTETVVREMAQMN